MLDRHKPTTFYPVSHSRLPKAYGFAKGSLTAND
ncbi:hypothetical protein H4V98_002886 [Polaromonas sp. CG_23.6]|nr:hypothetical protein [Polaromonas sp. CG_23.6]